MPSDARSSCAAGIRRVSSSTRSRPAATAMPAAAAATESRACSAKSCRRRRDPLAPSAVRTESSACRPAVRTTSRLAMFVHARMRMLIAARPRMLTTRRAERVELIAGRHELDRGAIDRRILLHQVVGDLFHPLEGVGRARAGREPPDHGEVAAAPRAGRAVDDQRLPEIGLRRRKSQARRQHADDSRVATIDPHRLSNRIRSPKRCRAKASARITTGVAPTS